MRAWSHFDFRSMNNQFGQRQSIRQLFCIFAIFLLFWGITGELRAEDFEFETDLFRYFIDSEGNSKGIFDKAANQQWLAAAMPFSAITKAGISYPISSLTRHGDLFEARYGNSGVQANFRIKVHPRYLVFELAALQGHGVEDVRVMQLRSVPLVHAGSILACRWNDEFAICLMSLSNRVNSNLGQNNLLSSQVVREFGMIGEKVALIAVPTVRFMRVVQEVEGDYGLPSPHLGGHWAKQSPDVRTSYLFTDLTEANADETIHWARLGGFKYILMYWTTWAASAGSYEINRKNFPRGEESLKGTIDKCHAAGLKVGMHMMTSLISTSDPLVSPQPDSRLLKDGAATLKADLSPSAETIIATTDLNSLPPGQPSHYDARGGADILIDNEIIHCAQVAQGNPNLFSGCRRGHNGTKAAPHKAGAQIHRLKQAYGYMYMADLRTSLKDQIAARVAGVINRCGFDMIYFDGGGADAANGPFWHWVGQQQVNIWKRVNRPLLMQGSELTQWTWHLYSRHCCDDYAALYPNHWLDFHKVKILSSLKQNFMPAELGWWGLLDNTADHPATLPDEIEQSGMRMLAFEVPISLETSMEKLKTNGRSREIIEKLSYIEQLRLHRRITPETREKLRQGHWQMVERNGQPHFYPVASHSRRLGLPAEITIYNPGQAQELTFRLSALPALAKMGDEKNIVLIHPDQPLALKVPEPPLDKTGALAARIDLTGLSKPNNAVQQGAQPLPGSTAVDLQQHRGLAISLKVEGGQPETTEPVPVINIQLQDAGTMYRDYYVELDFTGEKTIVIPETSAERLLAEFVPVAYNPKMALYTFNYSKIVALNVRWMRLPKQQSFSCSVRKVEGLAETDSTLTGLEVGVGDRILSVPEPLPAGSYLEAGPDNRIRLFDQNGNLVSSLQSNPERWPILQPGNNKLILRNNNTTQVKLYIK